MKKTFITLITLLISISSFAQYIDFYDECLTPDSSETSAKYLCNSKDGYDFPTKGTYRMLVIFINIIYDVTPDLDPNIINGWGWEADTIGGINLRPPKQYFDDVFDTHNTLPRQGFFTKYMSECSFDSLVILADFTSVGIRQSQIQSDGGSFEYLKLRDSTLSFINNEGGLQAYYNHNSISDYDNATCGYPPTPTNNDKLDYVAFFVLNPTLIHGGSTIRPGCGVTASGMNKKIKISNVEYNIEAWTMFGIGIISLKHSGSILIHEFAHGLLGGNEFHTSGGNHLGTKSINTFIYKQQGFGLFNSGNSFRSCNAYERWRLGWQHPSNTAHRIAAGGKNSDIVSQFSGIQTFYLRDFVTYGDVIRIKLPYKDSEEASNQYIWLENHQVGRNGKLDGFNYHFYPNVNCVPLGTPGIYSYIQVGKDILEGEDSIVFYNRETDNLRMISGEGNYNMEYKNNINDCIPWSTRPTFEYLGSNPLSGTNDLTEAIITSNNNLHLFDDFTFVGNKWKDNILYNQLIWYGDTLDAFTSGTKMDISSNPPPINAYTYYAKYYTANPNVYVKEDNYRDTRKKYLTGLSIKMNYAYTLADGTEVFKVDIRWDDYDVKENVNWAGDIVLKEELYLLPDKTITFEQNYTVYQTERDNITGVFAPPTLFTCEENSIFCQNSNSHVEVTERSTILLKSGSKYIISEGADLIIKAGCTLEVEDCAILEIKGQLIVENGANIIFHPNASIRMENLSKIIYSGNVGHLIYPYIWINSNITSNTTINQPITFTNDVVINTGITLTVNSTMKMTSDCRIIVKPGAKLIVDGGVLTSACIDKTWYGIHISGNGAMPQTSQHQGTVELKNNAVIENARFALMTYDLEDNYSTTGGIIYAEDAVFKNNRKSAVFWAYPTTESHTIHQNVSYFKNCTFVVDDNNLFENSGFEFESHITMWGVSGVKIYGCTFENNTSNISIPYKAIYTESAGYTIDQQCNSYNLTSCECKNEPTPSVFKSFGNTIVSTSSGSQYAIKIDRSNFNNNITGINISGANSLQLSRLNMSLETSYSNFPIGIYIDKCTGYKIEGNEIYSNGDQNSTGIHINHPGRDENKIYRNRIYKTGYAIKTTAIIPPEKDFPSTGLQFVCNNMYENYNDIFVTAQSIIRSEQGFSNSGADNLFTQTGNYDLYVNSSNTVNYYYNNSITRKTPVNYTNNINRLHATANPCSSTLCAGSISDTLGNGGITYKAKSSLAEYSELNKKYSEMMSYFYAKSYDKVLTDYYNGIIEDEKLLKEAKTYHEEILTLTQYMAELSYEALFALKTDSIIYLSKVRDWYDEMYTLNAKYSLAETYYQMGKYDEGFKILELIPKMFDLNEEEHIEHDNYVYLYNFKYRIMKSGRTIAELKKDEIEKLNGIAKKSYGLSSVMAQGVLCFFYDICYDNIFNEDIDEGLKNQKSNVNEITTNQNRITIYPNPGTDKITVISEIDNCNFDLINVNGVTQTTYKLQKGINIFDISTLVPGVYIYRVFNDGEIISGKWVKM